MKNKCPQRLIPIKFHSRKNWKALWLFKCECGNEVIKSMNSFKSGNTKSCGCLITNPPINKNSIDDTGKKYNRLTLIRRFRKRNTAGISHVWYECLCDCGNKTTVRGTLLRNNNTKSCGCLDRENIIKRNQDPEFIAKRVDKINKTYKIKHWKTKKILYCKGSWEYGTLLYLNKHKIDYKWQIKFSLHDNKVYICDLYLIKEKKYVEIKGRWMKDAWSKYLICKKIHKVIMEVWNGKKLKKMGILNNQSRINISLIGKTLKIA